MFNANLFYAKYMQQNVNRVYHLKVAFRNLGGNVHPNGLEISQVQYASTNGGMLSNSHSCQAWKPFDDPFTLF